MGSELSLEMVSGLRNCKVDDDAFFDVVATHHP